MMRIGELARRSGIRPSALRYYEQLGLISPPTRVGGARRYDDRASDRVAFIQFARACGFHLDEIAILVGNRQRGPVSARWHKLAAAKHAELDRIIGDAQAMKRFLDAAVECDCVDVDGCGAQLARRTELNRR